MRPVLDNGALPGLSLAQMLMRFAGISEDEVEVWSRAEIERATATADGLAGPIAAPAL
jgi:hypothetical protein